MPIPQQRLITPDTETAAKCQIAKAQDETSTSQTNRCFKQTILSMDLINKYSI
jgi:hypothetical protein